MFKVINKIGPYNGKFCNSIITYKLRNIQDDKIYAWHSGPNKEIDFKIDDLIGGVFLKNNQVDYKKSNPVKLQLQLF
jgi:hypothetical protein